jgi:predicted RNA methylase
MCCPQARVLVDYFVSTSPSCPDVRARFGGKRVVELGAGTGLVGLALAAAGRALASSSAPAL